MKSFLTETSLLDLLKHLYPTAKIEAQVPMKVPGSGTKRIDYVVYTEDETIAVEYDGHLHYTDTNRQLRDILVKAHCAHNNIRFIQFPYWLQPDSDVIEYLFDIVTDYHWDYPQGFQSDSCVLPGQFNEIGHKRFFREMENLATSKFSFLYDCVVRSLEKKAQHQYNLLVDIPYTRGSDELPILVDKMVYGSFVYPSSI